MLFANIMQEQGNYIIPYQEQKHTYYNKNDAKYSFSLSKKVFMAPKCSQFILYWQVSKFILYLGYI